MFFHIELFCFNNFSRIIHYVWFIFVIFLFSLSVHSAVVFYLKDTFDIVLEFWPK